MGAELRTNNTGESGSSDDGSGKPGGVAKVTLLDLPGQVRRPCGCTRLGKGMRVRRIEAGLAREIRSGVPRWAAGDTRIGQRGTAGHVVHRLHHRGTQEPRLTRSGGKARGAGGRPLRRERESKVPGMVPRARESIRSKVVARLRTGLSRPEGRVNGSMLARWEDGSYDMIMGTEGAPRRVPTGAGKGRRPG